VNPLSDCFDFQHQEVLHPVHPQPENPKAAPVRVHTIQPPAKGAQGARRSQMPQAVPRQSQAPKPPSALQSPRPGPRHVVLDAYRANRTTRWSLQASAIFEVVGQDQLTC
jgi:hypothetical protein